MVTLAEIASRYATEGDAGHGDKSTVHSYIPVYERLLAPYREKCSIMEIGIAQGLSLDMWAEYFGAESEIIGADLSITFDKSRFDRRFKFISGDATKPYFLQEMEGAYVGDLDIIIDDGSHMEADQIATFHLLKHRMKPGGLYIIEDVLSLEMSGSRLTALHPNCEVFDMRHQKGRFDDVLIVFRF